MESRKANLLASQEHAGWYLGFRRDGSCWSTANDMAHPQGPYPNAIGWMVRRGPDGYRRDMRKTPRELLSLAG